MTPITPFFGMFDSNRLGLILSRTLIICEGFRQKVLVSSKRKRR